MTAVNGTPRPDQDLDRETGMGGLAGLPGLKAVSEQLDGLIAVLRAEQARRQAGTAVARAAWKKLVFTGGPGSGKNPGGQGGRPHLHRARAAGVRAPARDRRRRPGRHYPAGDRDPGGRGGPAVTC